MAESTGTIYNAPSNLKSKLWKNFGFLKKDCKLDKSLAIWKLCKGAIKYTGSTTSLSTHLLRRHGDTSAGDEGCVDASSSKASVSKNAQDKSTGLKKFFQLSHNSARSKVITASITRFIAKDLRPYSVVESDGFRDMINTLDPRAKRLKHFEASDEDTALLITEMKKAFNNDFEKRYTHLHDFLYTASALDPCFKMLPFLSDHDAGKIFTSMSVEAAALHNKIQLRETVYMEIKTTAFVAPRSQLVAGVFSTAGDIVSAQHNVL
nr:PREDICTED: uncharacterized protein LOC103368370 [Stegastes partitus]